MSGSNFSGSGSNRSRRRRRRRPNTDIQFVQETVAPPPRQYQPPVSIIDVWKRRAWQGAMKNLAEGEVALRETQKRLADATRAAEDAEAKLQLSREFRSGILSGAREQADRLIEGHQVQWEIERDPAERLNNPSFMTGLEPPPGFGTPAIGRQVDTEAVQRIAVRTVRNLLRLAPEDLPRALPRARLKLGLHYEPYVVEEVMRRVEDLLEFS